MDKNQSNRRVPTSRTTRTTLVDPSCQSSIITGTLNIATTDDTVQLPTTSASSANVCRPADKREQTTNKPEPCHQEQPQHSQSQQFYRTSSNKESEKDNKNSENDTKMGKKSMSSKKEREKKIKRAPIKERWLLTRKTWKYMTDAGRKLIPDGASNRVEDIPKIEDYFQQVCRSEHRFLPWQRKASYPGALTSLRRKRKSSKYPVSSPPKASSADEAEIDEKDDTQRYLVMIRMLERFLNIKDSGSTSVVEYPPSSIIYTGSNSSSGISSMTPGDSQTSLAEWPISGHATGTGIISGPMSGFGLVSVPPPPSGTVDQRQLSRAQIKENWFNQKPSTPIDPDHTKRFRFKNETTIPKTDQKPHHIGQSQPIKNQTPMWTSHTSLLLESLRNYSKSNSSSFLTYDQITPEMLQDKRLLMKIRDELKKQQLMRLLRRHSSRSSINLPGTATTSSSTANLFNFWQKTSNERTIGPTSSSITGGQLKDLTISGDSSGSKLMDRRQTTTTVQTDPIPITVIYQLYDQYNSKLITASVVRTTDVRPKDQVTDLISDVGTSATSSSSDKQLIKKKSAEQIHHSRRKSSIDEDVSQSVSDTIKRYLRMARKKPGNQDDANRFKRVNYDKHQMRSVKPIRELTPPIDEYYHYGEDNDDDDSVTVDGKRSKGTQTDCRWIVIVIEQLQAINRDSFSPTESTDDESHSHHHRYHMIREHRDRDQAIDRVKSSSTSPSQSSPPSPSGTSGLFHSSTQFLSNLLWHSDDKKQSQGSGHSSGQYQGQAAPASSSYSHHQTTAALAAAATAVGGAVGVGPATAVTTTTTTVITSSIPATATTTTTTTTTAPTTTTSSRMQKSKSSSNVGPSFAKKIWKSRSKSHSRTASPANPHWIPQGNCVWSSVSGKKIQLSPTTLLDLTEVERKSLHRVAVDRINQLNIGVSVSPPNENVLSMENSKPQKKRPMLLKRKALTTGFFDSSKSKSDGKGQTSGRVFGLSLEKCVDNDNKSMKSSTESTASVKQTSEQSARSSRNSLSSLLDTNHANAGSCESLPSKGLHFISLVYSDDIPSDDNGKNHSQIKTSISQMDIRRASHDDDDSVSGPFNTSSLFGVQRSQQQRVPALVNACVTHLLKHGLDKVGIFRVSTSKRRVRQLREDFDNGTITTLDDEVNAHDTASLLKEFLRDLPEPLLCTNLYHAFVQTQKIRNRRLQLEALSHLIQLLPVAHRDTLYVLLKLLATIAKCSEDTKSIITGKIEMVGNKMDSGNLATVIAPNILHLNKLGQTPTETEIMCGLDVINVTRTMIDHFEELFMVPAEIMDDVYTTMMDVYPEQLDFLCENWDLSRKEDDFGAADGPTQPSGSGIIEKPLNQSIPEAIGSDSERQHVSDNVQGISGDSIRRRLYDREEFMHENAAKGDTNGQLRRRERTSKMKYQEPEHEVSRRRRRDRIMVNPTYSTISGNMANTAMPSSQCDIGTLSDDTVPLSPKSRVHSIKKRSTSSIDSPIDSDEITAGKSITSPVLVQQGAAGVVSASFKLPLQVQIHENPSKFNVSTDFYDIPYIEETGGCDPNDPIRLDRSSSVNSITTTIAGKGNLSESSSVTGTMTGKSRVKLPENREIISGKIDHHNEPKKSTSITNIGGAVLRSKTADFERLLLHNKYAGGSTTSTTTTTISAQPTTTTSMTISIIGTPTTVSTTAPAATAIGSKGSGPLTSPIGTKQIPTSLSSPSLTGMTTDKQQSQMSQITQTQQRTAPIYKRNELISSVQSSTK